MPGAPSSGTGTCCTHFVFRLGAGYDVPIGARFMLTPNIDVDFVGETKANLTYGVYLGFGF